MTCSPTTRTWTTGDTLTIESAVLDAAKGTASVVAGKVSFTPPGRLQR